MSDAVAQKPEEPQTAASSMKQEIDNAVATAGSVAVKQRVVAKRVEEELTRRANAVLSALTKREEAKKLLSRVKPDQNMFDKDGVQVAEYYSKAKKDERDKLANSIKKIDDALNAAFAEKPNYDNLFKIAAGEESKESDKPSDQ
jgi:hypothetical protein